MKQIREIELDLLENGLDFINNSLKPILESEDENELKYSVLHISSGTELVLKEILRKEHWSLIFENIDNASIQKPQNGDFQSASFETILMRLENIVDIHVSDNAKKHIRELRKKRNRIEHFAFKENEAAIKSNVSKVLLFILEIIREQLDLKNYSKKSHFLHKEILKKSKLFEEFTTLTIAKLKDVFVELEQQKIKIIDCPECFHHTLPLDGTLKCLFCGYNDIPEKIAHAIIENIWGISEYSEVKDGGYFPLEYCPECKNQALLVSDDSFLCISCGNEWGKDELDNCNYCNQPYILNDADLGMCHDCKESRMEKFMEN